MAELGFVCDGPNSYQVWLGGNPAQTAMAKEYKDRVKIRDIEAELEPLFSFWKKNRKEDEGFGYFVQRVGVEAVRAFAEGYVALNAAAKSVSVVDSVYAKLEARAVTEGKSVAHITNELLSKAVL
jgi:sulfite reductase (ferredoxin)